MIYPLRGVIQHYSWGGKTFLPLLLGTANAEQKPFAEYWLGAHPKAPSMVNDGSLPQLLRQQPELLGADVEQRFKGLPFLFKVLDVAQMLSIQVHPSKTSAEEGFQEEEARGIPIDAPHRNYKDANHKPELMAALGDFWLLHGFKPGTELEATLSEVPELSALLPGSSRVATRNCMNT